MLKFLLLFFISFFCIKINAKNETFTLAANEIVTFIIPVFTSNSTLENFNDTLNFLFNLPNLPKNFWFYAFGDLHQCLSYIPYSCNMSTTISGISIDKSNLNNFDFIEKIYENSIIENEHGCYVYLKLAYLLALKITPLCDYSTNCYVRRINFIALTDYEKIESFYDLSDTALEQSFYFAFTTATNPYGNTTNNFTEGYYYIYDDLPDSKNIAEDIFSDKIYYTFDPTKNFYNTFIVTNESSLCNMATYADYILEDAYSSIKDFWGFLSPLFYVASVKLENGSYYQTVNVYLNGMSSEKFITSLQTVVYGTLTNSLDTSIAQNYLKEIYASTEMKKDQWNVILTDEFPHWLKNTEIMFDSFFQHLDIYLMSFDNNTIMANELQKSLETNLNDILINDKNATKRGNHVLLLPFNGPNSIYESVKQIPTIKKYMGANYTFDPTKNFYNTFIVTNESSLCNMATYADYILEDAYSSIKDFWGFLSPLFYVASVKLENGSYYQTVNVFLNGMSSEKFVTSLQTVVYGTLTNHLDTSIAQNYLKEIYASKEMKKEQWNVILTDEFPHWLKNTEIIFDSFFQHLDIYLMSFDNNAIMANELQKSLEINLNDILINDKNSTKRGNHVLLLPFNGPNSIYESVKQIPTIKKYMGATIFSYHEPNQWWIWVIVGSVIFLIFIAILLILLLWKYRKWKKIMQKYSWAVDSGISIKEANTFVETGKELFIEGNFITVDFNEILGKGSSAIVYEGFLATESPVSTLYPRLETRNYSNCKTAIKIGNTFSKDEFEHIFREVEAAIKIGWHRHISCLLGWSVYQSMPILLFELIEGHNLLSWAESFREDSEVEIPEKIVTQILWQISDGMEYISSLGILHKDLAARNILLSKRLEAKITDFGLASSSTTCSETNFTYEAPIQRRLPLRWMPPEALKNRIFSESSDVWAFGTLAWEVFSKGEIPYGTMDGNDILEFLTSGNRLKIPEAVSDEWKTLLNECWKEEKEERPSFKEIKIQIGSFLENQTLNYGYLITTTFNDNKNI